MGRVQITKDLSQKSTLLWVTTLLAHWCLIFIHFSEGVENNKGCHSKEQFAEKW